MPLVPVLVNIESNGVRIDTEALKQSSEHFTLRLQEIEKKSMHWQVAKPSISAHPNR